MNRLSIEKRTQIVSALVEGNGINATARMAGVSKMTVLKLLKDTGEACMAFEDMTLRNLPCKNIQCDEIWSFCYAKEKNVPEKYRGVFGYGDVWTWTAIASRLTNRIQLTTDGHKAYLQAVDNAFGCEIDYAMLVKMYGEDGHLGS